MKLNVCLTIIPIRAARGCKTAHQALAQSNHGSDYVHAHSLLESGVMLRPREGKRTNAKRIATRSLWLKKVAVCA